MPELPALTFYNPLLNNPSSSEYVASVRSSLRSLDRLGAGGNHGRQFHHPQRASMTSLNYMSARALWNQAKDRSLESNSVSMDSKRPSPNTSSSAQDKHRCQNSILIASCITLLTLVLTGVACLVYVFGEYFCFKNFNRKGVTQRNISFSRKAAKRDKFIGGDLIK